MKCRKLGWDGGGDYKLTLFRLTDFSLRNKLVKACHLN